MSVFLGWAARIFGYAMPLVAAYLGSKGHAELAGAIGVVGSAVLHGTKPTLTPPKA